MLDDAGQGRHGLKIHRHYGRSLFVRRRSSSSTKTLGKDLRPGPRGGTEINDAFDLGMEDIVSLIYLKELSKGIESQQLQQSPSSQSPRADLVG